MIKLLDLQTDLNLSVVLLSSDLPLASPCEERPLASPCGANNPPPAAAAACQSIIVIFGENKQKQSADKRKITHCFILIKISTMQAGLEILVLCESYLVSGFAHFSDSTRPGTLSASKKESKHCSRHIWPESWRILHVFVLRGRY